MIAENLQNINWRILKNRGSDIYKFSFLLSVRKQTYIPRSIRFIEYFNYNDWNIKVYGISQHHKQPSDPLLQIAKEIAPSIYPSHAKTSKRYGTGFIIIHEADMFNQILFDWWENENELRHIVLKSTPADKFRFENITQTGEAFCIWEIKVISFERDAWLKYVLKGPPGIQAYIKKIFTSYE